MTAWTGPLGSLIPFYAPSAVDATSTDAHIYSTPLGGDVATTWDALLAGRSGVSRITDDWIKDFPAQLVARLAADPAILQRIRGCPFARGGRVLVRFRANGCSLLARRSGVPLARLRLTGEGEIFFRQQRVGLGA